VQWCPVRRAAARQEEEVPPVAPKKAMVWVGWAMVDERCADGDFMVGRLA
jgi:hypothetical protein